MVVPRSLLVGRRGSGGERPCHARSSQRPSTAAAGERARARPGERSRARASAAGRGGRGVADREVRGLVPGSRALRRLPVGGGSRVRPDRPFLEGRHTVDRQRRAALCGMPRPADAQHRPYRGEPRADRVDGVRALAALRSRLVEALEEPVRRELDLFVVPLRRSVDACDQPGAMYPPEVAEDERVSSLSSRRGGLR